MATSPTVELQVSSAEERAQREEELKQIEEAKAKVERAFAPRPWGTCGRNVWCYYFCCSVEQGGGREWDDPRCCDTEHIAMHFFFIFFVACTVIFLIGFTNNGDNNLSCFKEIAACPNFIYYILGDLVGFLVVFWSLCQLTRTINDRLIAAGFMDAIVDLEIETNNLGKNIQTSILVENKLRATHNVTEDTTNALRQKFIEIKQWTDQSKVISDQSSRIGALLYDKMNKLYEDLEDELRESEMAVIESIYNSMHLRDGEKGLDENEFGEFVAKLPNAYKRTFKFELGAFAEYAGPDGIFDRSELFVFLNRTVNEEAVKPNEERT